MRKDMLLLLSAFGLIVSLITLTAQLSIILQPSPASATAKAYAVGQASFCLNSPPAINLTCNATMSQNTTYTCLVNATDAQGDPIIFSSTPTFFNITPSGLINVTPQNKDVGDHSIIITAADTSGCEVNSTNTTFDFSVANINDPPYLIQDIPKVSFPANTTISAFYLGDYFMDPDGDQLNYTSTLAQQFTLTIMPSSEVRITSAKCGFSEVIIFTATDPYNASADSNAVTVKVDCAEPENASDGGGNGAGGGGGGGYSCKPKWECDDWFACLPTNVQWRRCYDIGGCEGEKYLKRTCEYQGPPPACEEDWLCTEWANCRMNGTQDRSCTDLNKCGTNITLPPLSQACTYNPTCNDNVQNGDETGVDCGGSCAACALIEKPAPFNEGGIATWIIIFLIIAVLIVSGIIHYYRAQIAQGIALLGFMLRHRQYKDVLLDAATRKSYFERLLAFEQLLDTPAGKQMAPEAVYSSLAMLMRQYYVDALGVHQEAIPEEVDAACRKLGLRAETTGMLSTFFSKLPIIEEEALEYDDYFVRATVEELRTIVCLTSDYTQEELMRPMEELAVSEKMSFYDEIFCRMTNALRACQFSQFDAAEKEYMTILSRYEALSEQEKEQIYPQLQWLFGTVKFSSGITGSKVVKKAIV